MANTNCPCCPGPDEPAAVPIQPVLELTALALADNFCTTKRDGAVRLKMEGSGPASETPITMHQMFLQTAENFKDHPAVASKNNDQWKILTWRQYYEKCRTAAKSFLKLGLERYHGVGVLGSNAPEWFIAYNGCIFAGGLATGIYTTSSPEACQYVAHNCEANVLLVEDNYQLQKILQVKDKLPHLKAIVQYKGELQQKAPFLYTWAEFMKLGEDVPNEELNDVIASLRANECCTLIYTSGTTGNPKGVMLSHDNGSLGETLKEVRPTVFLGVPRVWEKMQEKMKAVGDQASPMKKRVGDWAKSIGLQYNYSAMNGGNTAPWGFTLANAIVFKKVKAALGLDRCKRYFAGSAPTSKDTMEYFMSLNIRLLDLYGMSESSSALTLSTVNDFRTSSCGKVIPGCDLKLYKPDKDGNGEICLWGRNVFMGYLNMPDKTAEALDEVGWLHTGDEGRIDQYNFLYITGRLKELIITAGGENIPPVPIENELKAEVPIISNVMLVGDKLKFLSMLITLKCVMDDEARPTDELSPEVLAFCQQNNVRSTKVSEVIMNKEPVIYNAIQEGIERINAKATSSAQKVQKFVILEKDFSVDGGELTPTMKVKRSFIVKMYQKKIDEMYPVTETK